MAICDGSKAIHSGATTTTTGLQVHILFHCVFGTILSYSSTTGRSSLSFGNLLCLLLAGSCDERTGNVKLQGDRACIYDTSFQHSNVAPVQLCF